MYLFFCVPTQAEKPPRIKWTATNAFEQKVFIENKGQFQIAEKKIESAQIKFGARQDGLQYYFTANGIWIARTIKVERTEKEKDELASLTGKKDDDDDAETKYKFVNEFHQLYFIGANPSVQVTSDDEVGQVYNFTISISNSVQAHAFKKITYRNLYPGIDMEIYFPDDKQGFKYSFIVHPGADISKIRMQYPLSKSTTMNGEGDVKIKSLFGEFIDHTPVASQAQGCNSVTSSFELNKGIVQFNITNYDKSQLLTIDPWTTTPVFAGSNDAYDVDYDNAGNCYVYGGISPYQVLKFNSGGTLLWSYTESFTGGYLYYGDFAVDKVSQSVYIIDGYNPNTGTQVIKLNSAGTNIITFPGNINFNEMWRIAFSRCTDEPVVTGGGITSPSYEASYLDTNLVNLSPVNVLGTIKPHHDIWGLTFDDFGNCYMASEHCEPGITDTTFNNVLLKLPLPSLSPTTWMVYDGYQFKEMSSTKYTSFMGNGFNGMTVSNVHLYTYDSYILKKWNTANGALMNTLSINGASQVPMYWSGLTSDDCDNIFIGSVGNILQYNSSLTKVGSVAMPDTVHALSISKSKILYACGRNFVCAIQETLPACFTALNTITNPACGATTGSVIIAPSGGNAPYTVTWNTSPQKTNDTLTNLLPGTYIAQILDNSCPHDTIYDTVTIAPAPTTIPISVNSPTTCQGNTISLSASGGNTYSWSPSTGLNLTSGSSVTANPSITTTYTVTGIGSGGCSGTAQSIVTINPLPTISVAAPSPICDGNSTSLTANGATTYTWTPSVGLSATTGSSANANPTTNSIYIITGTNGSGCSSSTTIQVAVNPLPVISVATPAPICNGSSTALTANGASTYIWTPSTGLSATTGSSVNANPTTSTTYTIMGTSASSCSASTTVVLTVNPNPIINVATPVPICNGSSAVLTANGASTYTWTPSTGLSATTGSTVNANPTTSITYTIMGTSASSCSASTTVVLTVNPNPIINVATPVPICNGSSAVLTANGASTYTWSPSTGLSATTGSLINAHPTISSTYTITGTNGSGCSSSTTVQVAVNPLPVISVATPAPICDGNSTALTANGASTYTWTPSIGLSATTGSSVNANPTTNSTYIITGKNGSGCSSSTTVQVAVNPLPVISVATPAPICNGNSTVLTANGASTYTWTPSTGLSATTGSSVNANPTTSTTYTIMGTSTSNCSSSITVVLTVNPNPIINVATPVPICNGSSAVLTANGASTYIWSPSTGLSATTGSSVNANPTSSSTYIITGTNISGCSSSITVVLTVNPNPIINVATPVPICNGSSAVLTANGASTYTWTPSIGLSATTGSSVNANPTTNSTYIITGTNGNGCSSSTSVQVAVNPLPVISIAAPLPICNGNSTALTANGASTYIWTPSTGLSATTGSSVNANPTTNSTYIITGKNGSGCSSSTTVQVAVNPLPVISVATPASICNGNSTVLTANGASTYTWTPSTGLSATTGSSVNANPTTSTTYTIMGTSTSNCSSSITVVLTVNPNPIINVATPVPICNGSSAVLTANGASTYTWTPSTGLSATTGSTVNANPTTSITYTIMGTSASSCSASTTVVLTVNPNPIINVATPVPICNGSSAVLTANGASTYTWSPSTGLSATTGSLINAHPTISSTYTITGTNGSGCSSSTTVQVAVNPLPVISVATPAPICDGNSTALTANGASTYTWTPSIGLSATTGSSVNANPTTNSTYIITGKNGSGCSSSTTVQVAVNPLPVISVATPAPICNGNSTVLTANGASTYTWTPSVGLSNTTGSSVNANPTTNSTYIITGTNGSGCSSSTTVQVAVNPLPIITATTPAPICNGNSTTLTANGGTTYTWTPSTGLSATIGSSVDANPIINSTYSITGTSASGCSSSTTVQVAVNPLPVISVSTPSPICDGNSTALTANGASTYTWTPSVGLSNTTGSSVNANPTTNSTYIITGTNGSGCSSSATVQVAVNPLPVISVVTPAPICNGSYIALTANGASTYTWTPSTGLSATTGSSVNANPTSSSTYTITGTSASGCSSSTTVQVAVSPLPVISVAIPSPICNGSSTALTANGASTYTWTPSTGLSATAGSSVNANPTITTTYLILGTNNNGCSDNTTVIVKVNPLPILNVGPVSPSICSGDSTILTATGANSYAWSPIAGISSSTDSVIIAKPIVTTTYIIKGTSSLGCTASANILVAVNSLPVLIVTPSNPAVCFGNSTTITVNGANSYVWIPSTGLSSTTDSIVTANPTINTTYQVTGLSKSGCLGTATVFIKVNPNPVISVTGPPSLCEGQSAALSANGALNYQWSPSTSLNTSTGNSVTATPTINTTYYILGTDINGCKDSTTAILMVDALPLVTLQPLKPYYCVSASVVKLTGLPIGGIYSGNGVNGDSFNPTAAGAGGPYTITYTYTNANGCGNSASIPVSVASTPIIIVTPNQPVLCAGVAEELSASGASEYFWSPVDGLSNTTSDIVLAAPTSTTIYVVMGVSDSGCAGVASVTVIVDSMPHAFFALQPPSICTPQQSQFTNGSSGAASYLWNFGDETTALEANPTHVYTKAGIYKVTLTATNVNGCDDTISREDTVITHEDPVRMANAFMPDGHDINSYIAPQIICTTLSDYVFRVFNRWGQLLFQTYDPTKGWDGKYNGQPEPVGVYDYYIEFKCDDCQFFKKGNITLLR